jgi:hypothetical protein
MNEPLDKYTVERIIALIDRAGERSYDYWIHAPLGQQKAYWLGKINALSLLRVDIMRESRMQDKIDFTKKLIEQDEHNGT